MKTIPEITDEEIRSQMNFDALLQRSAEVVRLRKQKSRLFKSIAGLGVVAIAVLIAIMVWNHGEKVPVANYVEKEKGTEQQKQDPIVQHPISENPSEVPADKGIKKSQARKESVAPLPEARKSEENQTIGEQAYTQPEPLEGYPFLYDYLNRELIYPQQAMKDSIQGIVTVKFTITKEGGFENIKIENSLGEAFDAEAIRIIQEMPAWKPATLNGQPVSSKVSLPLTFHIKKIQRHE
ncbi:MAG: TonB family protein [Cyclobacteriaceae bacterium]|nr:TonB family protein [Cyclobacteriaceae bacterium]